MRLRRLPLRIALLYHPYERSGLSETGISRLANGLAELGYEPTMIACHRGGRTETNEHGLSLTRVRRLPEAPLRSRGFVAPSTQIPSTVIELFRGRFAIAHAFTEIDACAAYLWRRISGCPVVFTCMHPPTRANLSDRRGRLQLTRHAFRASDVVTVAEGPAQAAVERWLALDVPILNLRDAPAYAGVYEALSG